MLRITEQSDERSLTFKLEGRLVGEWTSELERCWNNAVSDRQSDAIRVELVEVTFDGRGADCGGRDDKRVGRTDHAAIGWRRINRKSNHCAKHMRRTP